MLQLYVWFAYPDQAGSYALVSIGISAMTTGFTSTMMAFDKDADVVGRRSQPKFYGYIPDNNGQQGLCLVLMTMISALHNVSRSLGVALLAASSNKKMVIYFVGGEIALYVASERSERAVRILARATSRYFRIARFAISRRRVESRS